MTKADVTIHNARIEDFSPIPVDVLTARALAPLPRLLDLVEPFFRHPGSANPTEQANNEPNKPPCPDQAARPPEGPTAILPKGKNTERELTDSAEQWMMQAEVLPSRSDPQGQIIRLSGLARKERRP